MEKDKFLRLYERSYDNEKKLKSKMFDILKKYKVCKLILNEKIRLSKKYQASFDSIFLFSREELMEEEVEVQGIKVAIKKVNLNLITFIGGDLVPAFYNSKKENLTEQEVADMAELKAILSIINYNIK